MNIAHAAAYGITIWLSILLFTLAAGDDILPVRLVGAGYHLGHHGGPSCALTRKSVSR